MEVLISHKALSNNIYTKSTLSVVLQQLLFRPLAFKKSILLIDSKSATEPSNQIIKDTNAISLFIKQGKLIALQ